MNVTRYDSKFTYVVVDGVYITGLGEDMVSAEKDEDFFTESVGGGGDVVTSEINNTLGTITVYVQTTSPQKGFLQSLANRTEPFSIWVGNSTANQALGGTKARLQSMPEIALGSEAEDMEFVFRVFDYGVSAPNG